MTKSASVAECAIFYYKLNEVYSVGSSKTTEIILPVASKSLEQKFVTQCLDLLVFDQGTSFSKKILYLQLYSFEKQQDPYDVINDLSALGCGTRYN